MSEREERDGSELEFESIPARRDIQLSKRFETSDGDEIRLISTVGEGVVLTRAGDSAEFLDTVVVLGESGTTIAKKEKGFFGKLWDTIKGIVGDVIGGIGGNGGEKGACNATVTVTVGDNSTVGNVSINTGCPTAPQ